MKEQKNKAIDKLDSIKRKLNYEGHKMISYKQKYKIAYDIGKITFQALNQSMPELEDFKKNLEHRSQTQWVEITLNYIEYCKQEINQYYKLNKLHLKVILMTDDEIQKNFYGTIKKIMKIKNQPEPDKKNIDKVMGYYEDLFQSKIIEHKRNILQHLILTQETITYE